MGRLIRLKPRSLAPNQPTPPPAQGSGLATPSNVKYVIPPHPTGYGMTATLPLVTLDSARVARTFASDITLAVGADPVANMTSLNNAIAAAGTRAGHSRIVLPLGAQFQGEMMLVPHTAGDFWTYIEAAQMPTAEGVRCNPSNMANAPTLTCVWGGTDTTALRCRRAANNYRVAGLHFQAQPGPTGLVYYTVAIAAFEPGMDYDTSQTQVAHCPTDIILDRIYVSGPIGDTGSVTVAGPDFGTGEGRNRQCLLMNGIRCSLVDSYLTGAFNAWDESHGILISNTPGPLKFVNNFCDAGSISFMVGGTMPALGASGGRPKDVECRRNQFEHPLAWMPAVDSGVGRKWGLKGAFELKNAERWLVEGNVCSRTPSGAQEGMCVVIKSAGSGGSNSAGLGTQHVTFRYNIVRNCRDAFNVNGLGDPSEIGVLKCHDVSAYHNLFYDVGLVEPATGGLGVHDGSGNACLFINASDNLKVKFNTWVHNATNIGTWIKVDAVDPGTEAVGFEFTDNMSTSVSACTSIAYTGGFNGAAALGKYCGANPYVWQRNCVVGLTSESFCSGALPQPTNVYPAAPQSVPTIAQLLTQAQFVDAAGRNYRLQATSPGKGIALGGADAGCNMDDVELATSGVVTV